MGNFFIVFFSIPFIRKYLHTKEENPLWDKRLKGIQILASVLLGMSFIGDKYEPTFNLGWGFLYLTILYFLYLNTHQRIAHVLFYAALPFVLMVLIDDLASFWIPKFYDEQKGYFDVGVTIGFIWLISYGLGASRQYKEYLKEQEKRKEEEEENKKVLARKEQLEVLVQERTAEILQQKQDLEHALAELKETQDQLIQREKLASLGELTAGIAHEIQNPLNFVNNFSEVSVELIHELEEERSQPNDKRDEGLETELLQDLIQNLQKITHHGKRASGIVKSMLEHSRASTGEKQLTDLNTLADEYIRLSYHGLRAKDKSFNADYKLYLADELPKVELIPQDFGRVLLNLLNNAFFAVQKKAQLGIPDYKPTVSITTKYNKTEATIEIEVSDNGTGIPEALKQKIFQPFFTTKPTGEGTGLGLSLSYDIVTKGHGGSITLTSNEGEGTTFIINLPI